MLISSFMIYMRRRLWAGSARRACLPSGAAFLDHAMYVQPARVLRGLEGGNAAGWICMAHVSGIYR
jgi:hypothetical protein